MYSAQSQVKLDRLIESLRKYRRYDLGMEKNRSLLAEVYVDPLPDNGVLRTALNDNTCFFVGRKGTGKSTVFLMAQEQIRKQTDKVAVYIDVYTLFAQAQLSPLEVKRYTDELGVEGTEAISRYLLHKQFIAQFLSEAIQELTQYLRLGLMERWFTDREDRVKEAIATLQKWTRDVLQSDFYRDIPIFLETKVAEKDSFRQVMESSASSTVDVEAGFSISQVLANLGVGLKSTSTSSVAEEASRELNQEFRRILSLYFDVKTLLSGVTDVLKQAGFKKVYIFLDDFSEIDEPAQRMIVDVLIAPLNNWSNEFYKMKIAAYPGRIYFGDIDRSKVDEVSLDFYETYASKRLTDLEQKAVDFTQRMISKRATVYLGRDFLDYVEDTLKPVFYEELFKATMNNPRRMGHLLLYCYNSQIVHEKRITATALTEATIRLYEKDESVFRDNSKIQQSFGDRLVVEAQRQLLNALVARARSLARTLPKEGSKFFRTLGSAYTSHFFVAQEHEGLLRTLEHNFFISKYHQLKDRDGKEVTIYCLNYGLCQKEQIMFGRHDKTDQGKYFTERAFNYFPIIIDFLKKFVELRCTNAACSAVQPPEMLPLLQMYGMLCPKCHKAQCEWSFGYKGVVEEIAARHGAIQLPQLEFDILKVLHDNPESDWYASAIGEEIDRNYQAVTWAAQKLIERLLLTRDSKQVGDQKRSVYALTQMSADTYFGEEQAAATTEHQPS